MDSFFKMEAIRGFLNGLRSDGSLADAVKAGNEAADYAVEKWNQSRKKDYTVHRSMGSQDSMLWDYARRFKVRDEAR